MNEDKTKNTDTYEDTATDKVCYDLDNQNNNQTTKLDIADVDTSLTPMSEPLSTDTIAISRPFHEKKENVEPEKKLKISCFRCAQKLDLSDMQPFSEVRCPSCDNLIIVPKWFDNYLLEELCGIGGMADVYRGLDLALDREVAIKILNKNLSGEEKRSKLFLHEARTAATLNHYAILPIYTCGTFEEQPYIVMQYMSGGSLEKKLKELGKDSYFSYSKILKWLEDATKGLENARRHGIIHHDIKPANFMLDEDDLLKIGDFGIAQAINDVKSEEIQKITKNLCSPDYVSPEKLLTGEEDHKGDIYSLGASFYQLITKQTLFPNLPPKEVLKIKILEEPENIKNIREDIPNKFARLIMSMLSRKPELRPSYTEINEIIKDIQDHSKKGKNKSHKPIGGKKLNISNKKIEKSGIKSNSSSTLPNKQKQKNSIKDYISKIVILIALFIGGMYLWNSGLFDIQQPPPAIETDYLPDVTRQLAKGDAEFALMLSERAITKSVLSKPAIKQASLQKALALYLNREVRATSDSFQLANKLKNSGIAKDDPAVIILSFLSSPNVPAKNLLEILEDDPYYLYVGNVAIFLREQYNNGNHTLINKSLRDLLNQNTSPLTFWGFNAFATRIPIWKRAYLHKKINSKNLEKLFNPKKLINKKEEQSKKTQDESLKSNIINTENSTEKLNDKNLSSKWLKENRAYTKNRPHPNDFIFSNKEIQKYLNKLPEKHQQIETARLEQIMNLRNHLVQIMLHLPYGKTSIKKKNGKIVKGKMMVGPKYISVKKANGKRERIYWKEVSIDQFIDFLEHYALFRKNAQLSGTITRKATSKKRNETAWEYLRIAILCDWYGKYNDTIRFARKAIAIDPKIKEDAIYYILN
jgi:serine/threonine protein kinase/DNA-directed RNA polymerase subunit RPC12/RpoP